MRFTKALCSVAAGIAMTEALFLLVNNVPGRHWYNKILLVGYLAGVAVSGNMHAPNDFVVTAVLSIGFACLVFVFLTIVDAVRRRRRT
jgi:hypothetical protein